MDYPMLVTTYRYWREKPHFIRPLHEGYTWTLLAVEDGSFQYEIGHTRGEAKPWDIVICPPHTVFKREMTTPLTFHYIYCYSSNEDPQQAEFKQLIRDSFAYKVTIPERDRLQSDFQNLLAVSHLHDPDSLHWRNHLVNDVWLLIKRETNRLSAYPEISDNLMLQAKEWIEHHINKELTVRDMAAHFNLHPVHFSRRFRSCFGTSPSNYMTMFRMQRAKMFLGQTSYKIDHIAQLCGYDNGFYFSRIFKKHTNMTPSKFRSMHAMSRDKEFKD